MTMNSDADIIIELPGATIIMTAIKDEEYYADKVTAEDRQSALRFSNKVRRSAFLAWRAVVRRQVGDKEISYDSVGAPVVEDSEIHIGVSHTLGIVAVILSNHKCAIDIEPADRDCSMAASRFVSQQERELQGSYSQSFDTMMWCAKEVLYKMSGRKELDLLRDMRISSTDILNGTMTGFIRPAGSQTDYSDWERYDMKVFFRDNIIAVVAIAD